MPSPRVLAALAAAAVALPLAFVPGGMGVGVADAHAAIPPAAGPTAPFGLPTAVEEFSPFLGQVSCDPVAKPGVAGFAQLALAAWGRGHTAALTRSCSAGGPSEHKEGRAWDWGLNPTNYADVVAGNRAVSWLLADDATNARRVGVMYIIWNNRIWSTYRRAEGWRAYTGGDPHTSHMHISFSWAGAMARTSWWTGRVAPIEYGPCIEIQGEYAPVYGDMINLTPCPPPDAPQKSSTQKSSTYTKGSVRTTEAATPSARFTPAPAP